MDRWKHITQRLHEETSLRYPENSVYKLMDACVNELFDDLETEIDELLYESFLVSCTGYYLDIRGAEYGILREKDETDASYRQRIFNMISSFLTVNFMKKQGLILYTIDTLDSNIRTKVTSNNPYLNNLYMALPRHNLARDFLLNDTIYEYNIVHYIKLWSDK
ncbi:hypothetical protein [Methanosphaera sp.]|uniref:hypothetical protein n=1 Tax=Methanosphaera sp. TaxID=2666342 RepID=UPI0025FC0725|nr:hypothetical protein [Methanosphaera sp.]